MCCVSTSSDSLKESSTERPLHSRQEMPGRWEGEATHTSSPGAAKVPMRSDTRISQTSEVRQDTPRAKRPAQPPVRSYTHTSKRWRGARQETPRAQSLAQLPMRNDTHTSRQTLTLDRIGERGDDQHPTLANLQPTPLRHIGLGKKERQPLLIR